MERSVRRSTGTCTAMRGCSATAGATTKPQDGVPTRRYFHQDLRVTDSERPVERWRPRTGQPVRLDERGAQDSRTTIISVHEPGGHGRLLAPVCRAVVHAGHRAVAPDLPLFGLTDVDDPGSVRYADWLALLVELVEREAARGPVVLFGVSIGGRLA